MGGSDGLGEPFDLDRDRIGIWLIIVDRGKEGDGRDGMGEDVDGPLNGRESKDGTGSVRSSGCRTRKMTRQKTNRQNP
jgi:hypothetical protein